MSINVIQLVQGALTEGVLQQLATRVGIAPDAATRVVGQLAPALLGSLMNKAASTEGASGLFASIMSSETNANIVEQLPELMHSEGLQKLFGMSSRVASVFMPVERLEALSGKVAEQTGVAASATHALTGVVGTTLLGVLKNYFMQHNGNVGQLPTLLAHQLPFVKSGITDPVAAVLGLGSAASFFAGVGAQMKAVSSHLEHPFTKSASVPLDDVVLKEQASRTTRWWWWVVAAAALVLLSMLLGRGCVAEKPPVAAEPAAATSEAASATAAPAPIVASEPAPASAPASAPVLTKDSSLTFSVDKTGMPTLHATLGSDAEKKTLLDALTAKFGEGRFNADISVDPETKPANWLDKLDALLPLMQLPGAEVKLAGEKLELSGTAADAKLGWLDKLKSLFGKDFTVSTFDVKQAVTNAKSAFMNAFGSLNTDDCAGADVVKVLNLQVINFATGASVPPQDAQQSLVKSADLLKRCAAASKTVKLEIGGYSDNAGNAASNLALSKKRAEAVRAYLVKQGVPGDVLTAQGYGDVNPVADNSTSSGRFANRRIEFKAQP